MFVNNYNIVVYVIAINFWINKIVQYAPFSIKITITIVYLIVLTGFFIF